MFTNIKRIKIIVSIGIAFSRIKLRNLSFNNVIFLQVKFMNKCYFHVVKITRVKGIIFAKNVANQKLNSILLSKEHILFS